VATTRTEDGHKQNTKTSATNQKDEETLDDRGRDGGNNFILMTKEQEIRLFLREHDDDNSCSNNIVTTYFISLNFVILTFPFHVLILPKSLKIN
jgi:hypothetical protein